MMIKNKKGGAFAIGMVIIVIFLVVFTWYSFVVANRKIADGVGKLDNLTAIYETGDRFLFYIKEASRFSAHQSFYNIAEDAAIDINNEDCQAKPYQGLNIIIWNEKCKPEQAFLEEKFISEYDKNFNIFLENYPEQINMTTSHTTGNKTETIITTAKAELTAEQKASYVIYNLSYNLDKKFILNLASEQIYLDDFPEIYNKINLSAQNCKEKPNAAEVEKCFKEIKFARWDSDAVIFDTWIFFELSTKKPFFFEKNDIEHFRKIKLNFGLTL